MASRFTIIDYKVEVIEACDTEVLFAEKNYLNDFLCIIMQYLPEDLNNFKISSNDDNTLVTVLIEENTFTTDINLPNSLKLDNKIVMNRDKIISAYGGKILERIKPPNRNEYEIIKTNNRIKMDQLKNESNFKQSKIIDQNNNEFNDDSQKSLTNKNNIIITDNDLPTQIGLQRFPNLTSNIDIIYSDDQKLLFFIKQYNLYIDIHEGLIFKQKAVGIVNPTDVKFSLTGEISSIISQIAGSQFRARLKSKYSNEFKSIKEKQVFATIGYEMRNCEYILNTIVPDFKITINKCNSINIYKEELTETYLNILKIADDIHIPSLSIPLLGIKKLSNISIVALSKAIEEYLSKFRSKQSQLNVIFLVNNDIALNAETIEFFKKQISVKSSMKTSFNEFKANILRGRTRLETNESTTAITTSISNRNLSVPASKRSNSCLRVNSRRINDHSQTRNDDKVIMRHRVSEYKNNFQQDDEDNKYKVSNLNWISNEHSSPHTIIQQIKPQNNFDESKIINDENLSEENHNGEYYNQKFDRVMRMIRGSSILNDNDYLTKYSDINNNK